jgi:predicted amidohydrolase YtcJ
MIERRRIPLLRDRHSHPLLYAALMDAVDLNQPGMSRESALARIRARASAGGSGWTIATGWNSGQFALDKADFDPPSPDARFARGYGGAIVVLNLSLHGLIVNDAGRELMRRHDDEVAAHLDDQEWIERNLRRVLNVFAAAGASPDRLRAFYDHLLGLGVYSAEEMLLVSEDEIRLFDEAGLADRTEFWAPPEAYDAASPETRARIFGIKLFTDGAIGVTTAAMHRQYRTAAYHGILLYSDDELRALIARYAPAKPMAIHAIGDAAIDQVVSAVDAVAREGGSRHTIRIEHAQLISESTASRAKALGLHLSMQPNFSEDSVVYADRLPDGYAARNNPFRMLIDRLGFTPGIDLYFGSDGMPHGALEALRQSLFPRGGHSDQVLTLDEFVAGYCLPDLSNGALDIEVDWAERRVTAVPCAD